MQARRFLVTLQAKKQRPRIWFLQGNTNGNGRIATSREFRLEVNQSIRVGLAIRKGVGAQIVARLPTIPV
ncbi:hypothetical protein C5167_041455 [Papaver somniferum]|nr:hypothetical protein C5167_041455 [Papaver somniferum]